MATEVVVRKWGNSMGVTLPKTMVENNRIRAKQKVLIELVTETNIKSIFGSLTGKMTGQKFKDSVREGWK